MVARFHLWLRNIPVVNNRWPYQNSSMGFVNQLIKIEYIFKIKKYCTI